MQEKLKEQMINEIAKNYARYLVNYGVDITRTWETVTQNAYALDQAYIRGRQDERDRFDRWREEHGNCGWIPCSERLPEEKENPITRDYYVYPVMVDLGKRSDIRYYGYGDGHWWHGLTKMDGLVTHWMDIKPYQPKGE